MSVRTSQKAALFGESVIREMTRLFLSRPADSPPGVNLAQGFPDFPAPAAMKDAVTWGALSVKKPLGGTARGPTRNAKSR